MKDPIAWDRWLRTSAQYYRGVTTSSARPTASRTSSRRAAPRHVHESSDESPPASPPQRAAPAAPRPVHESSDESPPASPPQRAAPSTPPRPSGRSISPFYVDSTGRRIPCSEAPPARLDFLNPEYTGPYRGYQNPGAPGHSQWYPNPGTPGHYQGQQNPAASVPPAGERYSPCSPRPQDPETDTEGEEEEPRTPSPAASSRDEDFLLEDITDSDATPPYPGYHGERAGEADDDAQTISSDSELDVNAPSAAHYRWEGEDRCGYWRGSWIQLIHTRYTSIFIEAPFRPTPDPIVTFPPSPKRLCIMAPDEDWEMDVGNPPEVRPPLPALGEDAVLPVFLRDRADDNAPLANDEADDPNYQPTGKVMQWESESSDSETETGQRFRRKEVQPLPPPDVAAPSRQPSIHRRVMSTERITPPNAAETNRRASTHATIDDEVTPPATPRAGPGDRGIDLSPGTLDMLMEELEPAVEGLLQELIPDWDPTAPKTAPTTAAHEVPPPAPRFPRQVPAGDYYTTDDPMPKRVAIPAAWWRNTIDQRVPLAVWQEIECRSYAARTGEGLYQVTMKTSGEVHIRFGSAE
ncbi:nascent polypeptide-associated complex subunit alpha, muscle-specific form-like [Drosophila kikkawai]|uniref:Nascent polypeptide-associated complex subunit alpha, muscle-specific form-like n=1 Tax=Drosophila kikkawai TaxID=30033 RepID=A0ABM4GFW8_DROKI